MNFDTYHTSAAILEITRNTQTSLISKGLIQSLHSLATIFYSTLSVQVPLTPYLFGTSCPFKTLLSSNFQVCHLIPFSLFLIQFRVDVTFIISVVSCYTLNFLALLSLHVFVLFNKTPILVELNYPLALCMHANTL